MFLLKRLDSNSFEKKKKKNGKVGNLNERGRGKGEKGKRGKGEKGKRKRSEGNENHLEFPVATTTKCNFMFPEGRIQLIEVIFINQGILGKGTRECNRNQE